MRMNLYPLFSRFVATSENHLVGSSVVVEAHRCVKRVIRLKGLV